ncbi:hypothetical protein ACIOGT_25300 [Streptomyces microflavus]|uniref:hypothetical protein n=1 Tax=Streptomyces microflavus TaxID=1919 RepID=UPI0037FF7B18
MPSVVGLLEQRELGARRRVDELREEADRAKPKAQVPVWREELDASVLSMDYQRILQALADRDRLHQGPLTCQEMAVLFGLDAVPAKVEALRSKAKRMVARGWLAERQPGRFTLARNVSGSDCGS